MQRKLFVRRFKVNQIIGERSRERRIRHRRSGGSVGIGKVADQGGEGGREGSADRRIWPKIYSDFCKNSVRITDSKRNSNEPVIEQSITFLSKHNLSRCLYCTTLKLEHTNVLIIRVHS